MGQPTLNIQHPTQNSKEPWCYFTRAVRLESNITFRTVRTALKILWGSNIGFNKTLMSIFLACLFKMQMFREKILLDIFVQCII